LAGLLLQGKPGVAKRLRQQREAAFDLGAKLWPRRAAQEQPNVELVLRPAGIELEEDEVCGLDDRHRQVVETDCPPPIENLRLPPPPSDDDVDGGFIGARESDDTRERICRIAPLDFELDAGLPESGPERLGKDGCVKHQDVEVLGRPPDAVSRERHPTDESRPRSVRLEHFEDAREKRRFHVPSAHRDGFRPACAAR
jgi:hypothetical protein